MNFLIHTYGRANTQITYNYLPPEVQAKVTLVVQARERHLYEKFPRVLVLPEHLHKLAETRQWLFTEYEGGNYICIMDDDLIFAARRADEPDKFRKMTPSDYSELFYLMESYTSEEYPLVGVGAREGGNYQVERFLYATRQMRIHCIHVPTYRKLNIDFNRVEVMEDFDVTLQFLEAGYENMLLNEFVSNQSGSNTSGGCSHYRTDEVQAQAAHRLAELHPGLVKVVKKTTKGSWGGGERTDVRISWKKALKTST